METSPLRFKTLRLTTISNRQKLTISVSGGIRLLQMELESVTRRYEALVEVEQDSLLQTCIKTVRLTMTCNTPKQIIPANGELELSLRNLKLLL